MESLLQQTFKDIIFKKNVHNQQQWKYQISNKFQDNYNHEDARKLFEILHNISICNSNNLSLSIDNFDVIIPINTTVYYEKVRVAALLGKCF